MTQKNSYKLSFLLSLTGFILGLLLVFIGLSGVSVGHAETRNGANKQGSFEIKKVDQNNKPLPGATFSLTSKDGKGTSVQTFTSNDKGIVDAQNLQPGTYTLKEETAPDGYDKTSRTWTVTVYENGYTKLVENPYNGEIISKAGSKDVSSSLQLENPKMSVVSKYGKTEVSSGAADFYRNHAAYFKMSFELKQKDKSETINPGDTFVLQLDRRLNPKGISQDIPKIIYDSENSPLAIGKYDAKTHQLTYTFTNYIAGLDKVQLSAELSLFLENKVVLENQTISDFRSTIGGQEIKYGGTVNVIYGNEKNQKDNYVTNGLSNVGGSIESYNTQTGDFTWYVYVNPNRTNIPYATMNLWGFGRLVKSNNSTSQSEDSATSSAQLEKVEIYEVKEDYTLPTSYGVDVTKLTLRTDITVGNKDGFPMTKRQRIDFKDNLKDGKRFVVKITGKTDQSGKPLVVQSNLASFNDRFAVNSSNPTNNVYFQNEIALSPSKGSGSGTSEFTKPSITVANLKRVAQLRFKKMSTDNVPLPEAAFELRSSTSDSQKVEAKSNEQGEVHFKDLTSGTYDLYETKAPKGYQQVTEKLATVTVDTSKSAEQMVKWEKPHSFVKVEANKEVTIVNHKETLTFSGKKIWENDRPDQRPAKIQVQLLQNGQKMPNQIQEVTKDNDWSYHFKDLPKYDAKNQEYKYSVEEVKVPDGYKVSYLGNDIFNTRETEFVFEQNNFNLEFGNAEIKGQSGSKIIDEDTLTSFKGKKIWKNDTAENRPQAIQVQLYADGVAVEGQTKFISGSGNEWSFEFKNLKKYNGTGNDIIYSVKEVTVPTGYDVTYSANDIINTKREVITQQGPKLEIEETLPLESGASGGTTTVEDSRPVDTLSGLSSEQGQSGDMTIEEDSATHIKFSKRDIDGKELAGATMELRDSSGKTISTWISDGQVKDFYLMPGKYTFVETAAPDGYEVATAITFTVNEQGQVTVNGKATKGDAHIVMVDAYKPTKGSGQVIDIEEKLPDEQGHSGSTTEIEDSKSSDVIIGGQGEVVDTTEDTQRGMTGHSGSTTEIEDSKSSDVIIGGQGQVVETTEDTQTGMHGDSGCKTEVEDTKLVQSFHFDNKEPESNSEIPKKDKPKSNTSLPATGEKQHNMFFWMVTSCSLISSVFVISLKTKKRLSSC
ncbi:SpaA isopeptide-forming pilin-related protein [Streptococcus pyogenes]|uniref:SpaA isopeptide-forming pilin-related protein n=1 Tax=Streptococcus pyogenes TaxID=1314 RepID=UPI00109BABB8|nr:SpaA isopeptide-forming pilin-related protein [Streptococcus pyogenes]UEN85442.1 fibronectin binding protein [Streptococcus pyogenes]VGS62417.1 fibronectin binding protein [Streptococcus pyogenes]VGS70694.1 fibronectin binding protein [Streptococcus pyogenes]VGT04223.1 fibronectin binding protein [Streptococcus pyogenes]VHK81441.1 fibronectin binding protein [Streptococcus pyogenes]